MLQQPVQYDKNRRLTPVAVMTSEVHFASGGRFPILILWEDGQAPGTDLTPISFSSPGVQDSLLLLKRTNIVLQLQWVENLVNWDSVERLQTGASAVPGWIDTARDWFGLRPDHAARIQKDDTGNSFLGITKLTWFYSVPIRVRHGAGYLLAGRIKDPQSKGGIRWQSLDEQERVLFEDDIFDQQRSDEWTWRAGYIRSQLNWDAIRVQLNVSHHPRTVAFDDVMLVEINEPDPTFLERDLRNGHPKPTYNKFITHDGRINPRRPYLTLGMRHDTTHFAGCSDHFLPSSEPTADPRSSLNNLARTSAARSLRVAAISTFFEASSFL